MQIENVTKLGNLIKENVKKVIVGKDDVIDKIVLSIIAGGHILLEDIPGTGKTTLAKALAKTINCDFSRVQFTPDLLPSDLTGINFYNQKDGEFIFRKGSLFTNILLADEINRATPRTQSSLLECMEEKQITADGTTYKLEPPFFVIATQNPIETQGTFPLPEAQMDRFFMRLSIGYPDKQFEIDMISNFATVSPLSTLESVVTKDEIVDAMESIKEVNVGKNVKEYIVALVEATRTNDDIRLGVSPRGTMAILRGVQAHAALDGRDFATPDDVKAVFADIVAHRILCKGNLMQQKADTAHNILHNIIVQTIVPKE